MPFMPLAMFSLKISLPLPLRPCLFHHHYPFRKFKDNIHHLLDPNGCTFWYKVET